MKTALLNPQIIAVKDVLRGVTWQFDDAAAAAAEICHSDLSLQELLSGVAEADRLRAAAAAGGGGRRHRDVRDHPALQRHQGASSPGEEGRGAPGAAQRSGGDQAAAASLGAKATCEGGG